MFLSGYISEHDLKIAKKLAYVIAGGKVPYGTLVDEQYLLDLEREAFLSLSSRTKITTTNAAHACKRKTITQLIVTVMSKEEENIMREAVIVAGARTPVGKAKKGSLATCSPR